MKCVVLVAFRVCSSSSRTVWLVSGDGSTKDTWVVATWSEDVAVVVRGDAESERAMSDSPVWLVTASDVEGAGGAGSAAGVLSASSEVAICS